MLSGPDQQSLRAKPERIKLYPRIKHTNTHRNNRTISQHSETQNLAPNHW